MVKFSSDQERAIHDLSSVILGDQSLFCPAIYNGVKEPADLAWVSNGCAVLFYMTSGTLSFEKKSRHNFRQLQGWLRKWAAGEALVNPDTDQRFAFESMTSVLGVSVIGGEDVWCMFEGEHAVNLLDKKVCACVTITDGVFQALAKTSVGIRDIIHTVEYLEGRPGERVAERDVIDFVNALRRGVGAHLASAHRNLLTGDELENAWHWTRAVLLALKSQDSLAMPVLNDICAADALWINATERALAKMISLPGEIGVVMQCAKRALGDLTIYVVVAAHLGVLVRNKKDLYFKEPFLVFISGLDLGVNTPIRMVMSEDKRNRTMMHKEMEELRERLLERYSSAS